MKNIKKQEGFEQVVVWPGTFIPEGDEQEFVDWIKNDFGCRAQYLEQIETKPDVSDTDGNTGGRNDILFAIHNEDIGKFSIRRLAFGMRWLEDVTSDVNGYPENPIYPERILKYKAW